MFWGFGCSGFDGAGGWVASLRELNFWNKELNFCRSTGFGILTRGLFPGDEYWLLTGDTEVEVGRNGEAF